MIVLDASALVELLLHTKVGALVADRISDPTVRLHTPHLHGTLLTCDGRLSRAPGLSAGRVLLVEIAPDAPERAVEPELDSALPLAPRSDTGQAILE